MEAQGGILDDARWRMLLRRRPMQALLAAAAICAIFVAGFFAGKHQSAVRVHTGVATVGYGQASVTVDGWTYGIGGGVQFWVDSYGGLHEGGWPSCLRPGHRPMVTFGAVPASVPGGGSFRQVIWVDCRG